MSALLDPRHGGIEHAEEIPFDPRLSGLRHVRAPPLI
jgi:hypothetical protein